MRLCRQQPRPECRTDLHAAHAASSLLTRFLTLSLQPSTMLQGALEPDGLGWGWDGEDDWDGTVLTLLALAVVAATALALHWFGSGQDQEAAGPASTTPGAQPSQAGGARPVLSLKSKVSGDVEGHSSGQGKPDPPGCGQGSPAAAGTQDQKLWGGGGLAAAAVTPRKTTGEVTTGGALGQQQGNASPEAPQGKGREPLRPGTALLGRSKVGGTSGPILIHFTPRSPGRQMEGQVEAGGVQVKVPTHQGLVHTTELDTSPWQQGVGPPGSLERGPSSRRWQVGRSSADRSLHFPKLDSLRLGAVVSVWEAVGAASSLSTGSQRPPIPQELPPSHTTQSGALAEGTEKGCRESSLQPAPVLALESREAGPQAPRESQGSPASVEGWPWERRDILVTRSFSQAPGSMGPWPGGSQCGHPLLSQGWGTTDASNAEKAGADGSEVGSFFSSGPGGTEEQVGHGIRDGKESQQGQGQSSSEREGGGGDRGKPSTDTACSVPSLSPSAMPSPRIPTPLPPLASPLTARPHGGLLPEGPTLLISPSDSLYLRVSQGPAEDETLSAVRAPAAAPAPAPIPAAAQASAASPALESAPTPSLTPAPAPSCAPSSGSRPMSQEHSVALHKDKQEEQISTSWENLISMVLRSHPFPRQERPQGRAPRAAPGSPRDPSTGAPSENRESGSPPEGEAPPLEVRNGSSDGMVPGADTGGVAEAGRQPQPSSLETKEAPTPDPPSALRGDAVEEKRAEGGQRRLPRAAMPRAPSQPPEPPQPGPEPSPTGGGASPRVPQPRKRSVCERAESSERGVSQALPPPRRQGQAPGEKPRPAGSGVVFIEKQKEARKLMVLLQRPGSWGVVEGPRRPSSLVREPASAAALRQRLDLGNCLDVLAFAQRHGEPRLAQETYALMSDNLLHVLGDPNLYRQLSGADRERILSLRTGRGQAVLGVLVLPSLYQVSRSGLTRGPCGEEAPTAGPAPLPPRTHLHVFNPRENTWRPLTQVPEEAPLRGCGLCTMHNYLFLAGGIRGSGAKAVCSNEVFCYNPLTNIWSRVRPMQQARAQLKLVALDGLLYAIGGECLYSMERYDPRTDAWTSRAPLPAGTFPVAHEAVACRGDIYVTGGHLFYRLLRYSPGKDAWDECPYSASHRRSSDMVALGGFLYRFDLLRGVGAAVMRYNTVTGSWSRAASLPLPDPAPLHCTALGNTIYCLNHQVTATFTVSEGTAQFQARELQPFPLGSKGVLCPFILTLPATDALQTAL